METCNTSIMKRLSPKKSLPLRFGIEISIKKSELTWMFRLKFKTCSMKRKFSKSRLKLGRKIFLIWRESQKKRRMNFMNSKEMQMIEKAKFKILKSRQLLCLKKGEGFKRRRRNDLDRRHLPDKIGRFSHSKELDTSQSREILSMN